MMSNEEKRLLRALGVRDAAWTMIAKHEQKIKELIKRGIRDKSDTDVLLIVLNVVLGDIAYRRAEMKIEIETERIR